MDVLKALNTLCTLVTVALLYYYYYLMVLFVHVCDYVCRGAQMPDRISILSVREEESRATGSLQVLW